MTPKLVSRRYSKGRVFEMVCRKGYRKSGMCARRNADRVSGCEATHCNSASALHTRFDWCACKTNRFLSSASRTAKSGLGTAYHFHANVRAASQRTFEHSCGHSKVVEPHFRTTPSIGPPLPTDQPPESLPTYSNEILTPLVGPPL